MMNVRVPLTIWRQRLHALATYDCFPELSARVRRLVCHPLGVLMLAAVAALLCGLFLHAQGLVLFGGVVAVIALGVAWPWLSLRGLSGTLSFARPRATEGEPVEVGLTLRNRLPWAAWGLAVRDGFGRGDEPAATIASTPRRRTARCRWMFTPDRRGVYPTVVPRLTTGFPFGLWESGRRLSVEAPLIVWPRTYPVGPVPLTSGDQQVEGNVSRNKVGSGGDVLGVRPYRRGDSPRRIHWAQSARHDRLIVCELQANARPVVQLVLDTDLPDEPREWAVRLVASFAKGWLEEGAQVGAAWNGECVPVASGRPQVVRLLDALAKLPPAAAPLHKTLASPACRDFREGLQVIVSTDESMAKVPPRPDERQRFVVLRAAAFGGPEIAPAALPFRPWLTIDSIDRIPALLRGGWKEARHGS